MRKGHIESHAEVYFTSTSHSADGTSDMLPIHSSTFIRDSSFCSTLPHPVAFDISPPHPQEIEEKSEYLSSTRNSSGSIIYNIRCVMLFDG
jgi:hypothetical protein